MKSVFETIPDHLLSDQELEEVYHVDTSNMALCRNLRRLGYRRDPVRLGRDINLRMDDFLFYSDKAVDIYNLTTGETVFSDGYLKQYLSMLQPFMMPDPVQGNVLVIPDSAQCLARAGKDENIFDVGFPFPIGIDTVELDTDQAMKTAEGAYVVKSSEIFSQIIKRLLYDFEGICGFVWMSDIDAGLADGEWRSIQEVQEKAETGHGSLTFSVDLHMIEFTLAYLIDALAGVMSLETSRGAWRYFPVENESIRIVLFCFVMGISLDAAEFLNLQDFLRNRYATYFNPLSPVGEVVSAIIAMLEARVK